MLSVLTLTPQRETQTFRGGKIVLFVKQRVLLLLC